MLILSCLLLSVGFITAQTTPITGTVVDGNGESVIGASVVVKGTTIGTVTDIDGKFSLNVPADNNMLVFSLVGMKPIEQRAAASMRVVMQEDSKILDEIIVTGLGIRKSEKGLGYSVSKISADDMVRSGESNVIQGLAAKTSGLMVTSSSGTPGASSKIVLRGYASFSGDNQPLIVIDGVPMDNNTNFFKAGDDPYNQTLAGVQTANRAIDLNPEDIESVSVLKGPAAAAIYGQAAGNGAIIYTTKKGKARKGLGIDYSSSVEFSNVSKLPKIQKRYGQGSNGKYSNQTSASWGEDLTQTGSQIYDNIDDFFETGHTFINNLSIDGGGEKTTFRASINATNMTGIIPESEMNRYSVRLTSDTQLSNWLTVGGTMSYTNTKSTLMQNGSNTSGIMLTLMRMPVDFHGKDYFDQDTQTQKSYLATYDNPFFSAKYNPFKEETDRFLGNMYTDIKLNDVFSVNWRVGLDAYSTTGRQIYAYDAKGNDYGDGTGQLNQSKYNYRNLYTDFLVKFNTHFGSEKQFNVAGLVGFNYNYKQGERTFERGRGLAIPGFYGFSGMKEHYLSDRNWYRDSKAIFADATIDYKSLVFLSMTARYEWSSTFGKDAGGFFYPKVDASYVFSHLLGDDSVLNYGKVRVAYANVGISPLVYTDRMYYSAPFIADGMTSGFSFPYLGQSGYALNNVLTGKDLKPERNIGKEIGLDLRFLDGKLNLEGTFYNQTSKDLLIEQPLAPSSGFSANYINIGEIQNQGWEVTLSGEPIRTSNFSWNVAVNWSKNNSEVKKLAPGVDELSIGVGFVTPKSYAIVGQPYGVFYGTKFKRDNAGNLLINPESGLPTPDSQMQKIGDPNPDWLMNINNSFTYKDFTFSFLIDIRQGGDLWSGTVTSLHSLGKSKESGDREREYIIPGVYDDGSVNNKPISASQYFGAGYKGYNGSEMSIEDGSWVRVRAINLSYRFNFLKKNPSFPVRYLEVGTTLRNMILFTDYKGVDPETSMTGAGENLSGYDFFNNPGTKSVLVNLRLGF